MPQQAGNDPNERLPMTGTVHLVRDSGGSISPVGPTAAESAAGAGKPLDSQATLPISSANLAQTAAGSTGGVAVPESKSSVPRVPTVMRFRHLQSWREGGLGRVYIALDE